MEIFQKDPEYQEDNFEFWQRFEVKKRTFETKQNNNKNEQKNKYQYGNKCISDPDPASNW